MKNRSLIPLLAILALVFLGLWKLIDGGSVELAEVGAEEALDQVALVGDEDGEHLPDFQAREEEQGSLREVLQDRVEQPSAAPVDLRSAPSNARWISGRVLFPERAPNDMGEITVTARGRSFGKSSRREHTVAVDRNGEFRVAFSKQTRTGWLSVRGRYLYSPEKTTLDMSDLPRDLVLEPELGGILRGTVRAPSGLAWDEPAREGAAVRVNSWRGSRISRKSDVGAEGQFELRAVPPGKYRLECRSPLWANQNESDLAVRAGEITEHSFQLTEGSIISGRVVNDEDVGRGGVSVELTGSSESQAWIREFTRTAEDGSFLLRGVGEGDLKLKAAMDEFLVAEEALGLVRGGLNRTGIVLRISEGHSIQGVVRWPDGSPASGAWVSVSQDKEVEGLTFSYDDSTSEKTRPDGTFEISGLEPGPCVVRASAKSFRPEDLAKAKAREEAGKKPRRMRPRGPTYQVRIKDVAPGTSGLVVVLNAGDNLSGKVVDDLGEGVGRFLVTAKPGGGANAPNADEVHRVVLTPDGAFTIDGLSPGDWRVRVNADDHETTEWVNVTIPGTAEVQLVANRLAQVEGVVRDSGGEVVSGAAVHIEKLDPDEEFDAAVLARPWGEQATTNQDGKFKAKDVAPGRLRIWAKIDGSAASAAELVFVDPGATVQNVSLRLRRPARIRGELHASISNREERSIQVSSVGKGSYWDRVTTDSRGEFELEGLDAGSYRLNLQKSGKQEDGALPERDVALVVDVTEGDTANVVLGGPPANPTLVSGVVLTGGEGAAGVLVRCRAASGGSFDNDVTRTEAGGKYSLTLGGTGAYVFELGDPKRGVNTYRRDLASGENSGLDFVLPTGTIAGSVLGSDGSALSGCKLTLETVKLDESEGQQATRATRRVSTSSDGEFIFERLAPGTYNLRVNDEQLNRWQLRTTTQLGTQVVEGLRVPASGQVDRLGFRLAEGGTIQGTVNGPDGQPVSGARVTVKTPSGMLLHGTGRVRTDSSGRFTYRGIGVDRVVVQASLSGNSGPARSVHVNPGGEEEVVLDVE